MYKRQGLDDDLMKIFGGDMITKVYNTLGADENMPIQAKMLSKACLLYTSQEIVDTDIVFPVYHCQNLKQCVDRARKYAAPGEVVLFSPASASFDMFKNFEERGEKFKELVNNLE